MMIVRALGAVALMLSLTAGIAGCAAVAVVDSAVSVAATGVKLTASAAGAAANAVIPDGKKDGS